MKSITEADFSPVILQKITRVREIVQNKRILVAYSGGIDSTLVCILMKEYAKSFLAVCIHSPLSPSQELENAKIFSQLLQFPLRILNLDILDDPNIQKNDPHRCYYCKQRIITELTCIAQREAYDVVVDGTNFSDLSESRAGLRALKESSAKSPLADTGITKSEIIEISRVLDLPSQTIPSQACLASRIPFNLPLTPNILQMVDKAEAFLRKFLSSYEVLRVRVHPVDSGGAYLARIEASSTLFSLCQDSYIRDEIVVKMQEIGFLFTTIDLAGFRSGSMHQLLLYN